MASFGLSSTLFVARKLKIIKGDLKQTSKKKKAQPIFNVSPAAAVKFVGGPKPKYSKYSIKLGEVKLPLLCNLMPTPIKFKL